MKVSEKMKGEELVDERLTMVIENSSVLLAFIIKNPTKKAYDREIIEKCSVSPLTKEK